MGSGARVSGDCCARRELSLFRWFNEPNDLRRERTKVVRHGYP